MRGSYLELPEQNAICFTPCVTWAKLFTLSVPSPWRAFQGRVSKRVWDKVEYSGTSLTPAFPQRMRTRTGSLVQRTRPANSGYVKSQVSGTEPSMVLAIPHRQEVSG